MPNTGQPPDHPGGSPGRVRDHLAGTHNKMPPGALALAFCILEDFVMRLSQLSATFALGTLAAASLPLAAQAADGGPGPVVGRVTIVAKAAALGVGYTWGNGTLYFRHHTYHFTVKGVTVADVGYGRVYKMDRLSQFSGTYAAATGEATLGNGIGGQFLTNGNGVQIRVDEVSKGARLSGSADGIQLTLR